MQLILKRAARAAAAPAKSENCSEPTTVCANSTECGHYFMRFNQLTVNSTNLNYTVTKNSTNITQSCA